jgi:hypothetical protein
MTETRDPILFAAPVPYMSVPAFNRSEYPTMMFGVEARLDNDPNREEGMALEQMRQDGSA